MIIFNLINSISSIFLSNLTNHLVFIVKKNIFYIYNYRKFYLHLASFHANFNSLDNLITKHQPVFPISFWPLKSTLKKFIFIHIFIKSNKFEKYKKNASSNVLNISTRSILDSFDFLLLEFSVTGRGVITFLEIQSLWERGRSHC